LLDNIDYLNDMKSWEETMFTYTAWTFPKHDA
jgi:hypothetical protein